MNKLITFFSWHNLTSSFSEVTRYAKWELLVLGILIITGIFLYWFSERKKTARFYKKFIKKVGDALIYIPALLTLLVLAQYLEVDGMGLKIYFILPLMIWLIWIIFLIYYRIVVIPKLWDEYFKRKQTEKYLKNGKR
ncbi:MAG: hypothetical protein NTZ65_02180 [Candidatus Berkelbacteria bacterium]|nr:hypothetical protein [Candidatus Berkelbacteria bacterium]